MRLLFVVPNIARFETGLEPRPHGVPHVDRDPRGDAPVRVRAALGARSASASCSRTTRRPAAGRRGVAATARVARPVEPGGDAGDVRSARGLFGPMLDDEQRLKLGRIQAFMGAGEGYGDHVMHALGAAMLPSYARIDEAMRRYREARTDGPGPRAAARDRGQARAVPLGRAFCDAVVDLDRRGDPRADVGLGRRAALAPRARGAAALARRATRREHGPAALRVVVILAPR